jgi:hypothetical protein
MISKKVIPGVLFLTLLFVCQYIYAEQDSDQTIISEVDTALLKLITMQKEIKGLHPFLNQLHPIAIVENDHLYIFDFDHLSKKYQYQKKEPVPFPMPEGIRASFPLSSYGGANFIKYIVLHESDLFLNIELLFNRMWEYNKSEDKNLPGT